MLDRIGPSVFLDFGVIVVSVLTTISDSEHKDTPRLCCTEPVVYASMGELQHVVFRLLLAFESAPASKQNLSTVEIYRTFPFPRFCELILFKDRHEGQIAVRFFDPERFSIRILSFHSPVTLSAGLVRDRARQ
jgi:hypothetical protein